MGETSNSLEERNANQKKLIERQVNEITKLKERIKNLEIWERFAGHLLHNCEQQVVTEESLQRWLAEMVEAEKELPRRSKP